jgi:transposase-like protein
VGVVGLALVR